MNNEIQGLGINTKVELKTAISLGNWCEPAVYGVRHGLRVKKRDGYRTCPFDLMVTDIDGVLDCIQTDFKYFYDVKYIEKKTYGFLDDGTETYCIKNKKYPRFLFNHEGFYGYESEVWEEVYGDPAYFYINNYENFISRYRRRVENFNYYCNSENHITFIVQFHYDSFYDEYNEHILDRIKQTISNKYKNLDFDVLILKTDWEYLKKIKK